MRRWIIGDDVRASFLDITNADLGRFTVRLKGICRDLYAISSKAIPQCIAILSVLTV